MKHPGRIAIAVGIIVCICTAVLVFLFAPQDYKGKEVFTTVGEYTEFKTALASDQVTITKLEVLSSDPPIVVQFEVVVPRGYPFLYGSIQYFTLVGAIMILPSFLGLFGWLVAGGVLSSRRS